jgi:hypothetical protein
MSISSIESIYYENGVIYVSAIVEDVVQTYAQTYYEPAEYGAALCEASFTLDEDDIVPSSEHELIQFLDNLDLDWQLVDTTDY